MDAHGRKDSVKIEALGNETVWERDLFVLDIPRPKDLPVDLGLPDAYCVALVAWDARQATDEEISDFALRLVRSGAAYVCAWGPDCQRVHDIIDKVIIDLESRGIERIQPVITTWHANETLASAMWFTLFCAVPDDAVYNECGATLGIAVGCSEWADDIRRAFRDPAKFMSDENPKE